MKNAMKKIMSLMLIAVLLVSAIPMTALAASTEDDESAIAPMATFEQPNGQFSVYKDDGTPLNSGTNTISYDGQTIKSLVQEGNDTDKYYLVKWEASWLSTARPVNGAKLKGDSWNDTVYAGMDVKITLGEKTSKTITLYIQGADKATYSGLNATPGTTLEKVYNDNYTKQDTYIPVKWETNDNLDTATSQVTNNTEKIYVTVNTRANTSVSGGNTTVTKPSAGTSVDDASNSGANQSGTTTPSTTKEITANFYVGNTMADRKSYGSATFKPEDGKSATVRNIITYKWFDGEDWTKNYELGAAYDQTAKKSLGLDDAVPAGNTVDIRIKAKSNSGTTTPSTPTTPSKPTVTTPTGGNSYYEDGKYVYQGIDKGENNLDSYTTRVKVYVNNNFTSANKIFDITKTVKNNGTITRQQIINMVAPYYTAADGTSIEYFGLYLGEDEYALDYIKNRNAYDKMINMDKEQMWHNVDIVICLKNAKVKSTNADPNNPKTGDSIGVAMAVMGLSVTALAAVYVLNKKRIFA